MDDKVTGTTNTVGFDVYILNRKKCQLSLRGWWIQKATLPPKVRTSFLREPQSSQSAFRQVKRYPDWPNHHSFLPSLQPAQTNMGIWTALWLPGGRGESPSLSQGRNVLGEVLRDSGGLHGELGISFPGWTLVSNRNFRPILEASGESWRQWGRERDSQPSHH